jgi:hypothetical protein
MSVAALTPVGAVVARVSATSAALLQAPSPFFFMIWSVFLCNSRISWDKDSTLIPSVQLFSARTMAQSADLWLFLQ